MNKKTITISIVVILIIIFFVYFVKNRLQNKINQTPNVPYVETTTVGSVPDVNPAGRVNPLKDIKTNPFE